MEMFPWVFPHTVNTNTRITDIPGEVQVFFTLKEIARNGHFEEVGSRGPRKEVEIVPGRGNMFEYYHSYAEPLVEGIETFLPWQSIYGLVITSSLSAWLQHVAFHEIRLNWQACQGEVLSEPSAFVSLTSSMPSVGHETYALGQIMIVL